MHWDFDFCLFFWFWSGRPSDDLFTHGLNQLIPRDIHSHYVPRGQPPQYVCYNFFWIPRLVVNNSTQQSNSRQQSRWITTRDGIGRNHHKQNNITCLFFGSIGAKPQWMEFIYAGQSTRRTMSWLSLRLERSGLRQVTLWRGTLKTLGGLRLPEVHRALRAKTNKVRKKDLTRP